MEKEIFDFKEYEEIRLKNLINSYKEFLEITDHEELLIIALRGHLYIEREVSNILKKVFKDNTYKSLTYAHKVELCNSVGLINKERIPPLRKINTHRNGYAHNLDYRITEKDFGDLLSTLSKESKTQFEKELDGFYKLNSEKEKSLKDNYRILLAAIWAELRTENIFFYNHFELRARQILDDEALNIRALSKINDAL
ncbi:hypothetical protein [Peribacillus frigoritolerans]|uniref:hypothetical protein n=1 Tax=Peribacillus frigoritolerans TaxID=450367 RepID=UPI00315DA980